ncbi:hypothetical protein D3C78_1057520 [compost metagenome]
MAGQVIRAGQQIQLAAAQRAGVQGGVGEAADADGDVGALLQQIDIQVVGVELQLDIRVQLAEGIDVRHDRMQHERRGGIDPQAPGGCLLAQGEALFQRLHLFEDVPGVFQEERAFLGQLHPPRGAVEQGGGELFLQLR